MKRWVARLVGIIGGLLLSTVAAAEELKVTDTISIEMPPPAGQCRLEPEHHPYDSIIAGNVRGGFDREFNKVLAVYESCETLDARRRNGYPEPLRTSSLMIYMWKGAPTDWGEDLESYEIATAIDIPLLQPNAVAELQTLIQSFTRSFTIGDRVPDHQTLASLWRDDRRHAVALIHGLQEPIRGSHFVAQVNTTFSVDSYVVVLLTATWDFSPAAYYDMLAETLEAGRAIKVIRREEREAPANRPAPGQSPW